MGTDTRVVRWSAFAFAAVVCSAVPLPAQSGSTRKQTVEFYLPLEFGVRWNVLQGQDQGPTHNDKYNRYAVDFQMPEGSPVHAAANGVVVAVKEDAVGPTGSNADNNKVVLRHADGTATQYLHLRKNGALVELGQRVFAGDQIGWSGNTGRSGSPHLHFVLFSSYPSGVSIPVRFAEVKGNGVPKTGESPVSLNLPGRDIVGGLEWLQATYELCRILDRRGAIGKLLKSQVGKKRIPRAIARRIAVAAKRGRKGLDVMFKSRREILKSVCDADLHLRLAEMDKAVAAKQHAAAVRMAFLGNLDFGWLPESTRFRRIHAKLARDKAIQVEVRTVVKKLGAERTDRNALAKAFDAAWKVRTLTGKRRAIASSKARKSFDAILEKMGSDSSRRAVEKWMAARL
jgi:Peptidase family M23